MSVDDDPEVLAAIERDLRQHYRRDYRIVRASSGRQALDTARELKQRGTPIALFLVDERMPEMTGTQTLREVRKLHPEASIIASGSFRGKAIVRLRHDCGAEERPSANPSNASSATRATRIRRRRA